MTKAELKYYSSLNQKKYRDIENRFLIEGTHLIEEILKSKYYSDNLEKVFLSAGYNDKVVLDAINKKNIMADIIGEKEINKLSDTKTTQGIIGVVKKPDQQIKVKSSLLIALDGINDPGNLGTIIRTCYWFNVDELILSSGSADVFNPKVIRSSQGAVFNIAIRTGIDLNNFLSGKHKDGFKVFLTSLNTSQLISDLNFSKDGKFIFVFGNESKGISNDLINNSEFIPVSIPSYSDCESLNVGISVGIVLNEFRSN